MHYKLILGVPAIAVGLSAISLLAQPPPRFQNPVLFPIPVPVPKRSSQRMPLQSLTHGGYYKSERVKSDNKGLGKNIQISSYFLGISFSLIFPLLTDAPSAFKHQLISTS